MSPRLCQGAQGQDHHRARGTQGHSGRSLWILQTLGEGQRLPREVGESPPLETPRIQVESSPAAEGAEEPEAQGRSRFPRSPPSRAGNARAAASSWECPSPRDTQLQPWELLLQLLQPLFPQEFCTEQDVLPGTPPEEPQEFPDPQAQERPPSPSQGVFLELPRRSFLAAAPAHSTSLCSPERSLFRAKANPKKPFLTLG